MCRLRLCLFSPLSLTQQHADPPQAAPPTASEGDLLGLGSQDISNNIQALHLCPRTGDSTMDVPHPAPLGDVNEGPSTLVSETSPLTAGNEPRLPSEHTISEEFYGNSYARLSTDPEMEGAEFDPCAGIVNVPVDEFDADPGELNVKFDQDSDGGQQGGRAAAEAPYLKKKSGTPKKAKASKDSTKDLKKGLGRFQKVKGSDPDQKPLPHKEKEQKGGLKAMQDKAKQYKNNLSKAAFLWSQKGLVAMRQGLEAAQEWMDKGIESRKKGEDTPADEHNGMDQESAGDPTMRVSCAADPLKTTTDEELEDVAEIAAALQGMMPADRSLVLKELEPHLQVEVLEYLKSQGVEVLEDEPPKGSREFEVCEDVDKGPQRHLPTALNHTPLADMPHAVSDSALTELKSPHPGNAGVTDQAANEPGQSIGGFGGAEFAERSVSLPDIHEADLLGMGADATSPKVGFNQASTSAAPFGGAVRVCATDPDELDSFFQGAPAAVDPPQASPPQMGDFLSGQTHPSVDQDDLFFRSSNPPVPDDELMTFGGAGPEVGVAGGMHGDLYAGDRGCEGEPEIRRILRERRVQEKHAKMAAKLQEKILREHAELERQEAQVSYKDQFGPKLQAWKDHHRANIRGMLTSLHTVLWEGAQWKPISVGDVLDAGQVKKVYMKANLLVHPDKVRQKNGTDEQVVIADMIFDALKEAWNEFQK